MQKYTTQQIIDYTNNRLKTWYRNAQEEYGVDGYGLAFFNIFEDCITIYYKENGEMKFYSVPYFQEENLDYVFEVWAEQAE